MRQLTCRSIYPCTFVLFDLHSVEQLLYQMALTCTTKTLYQNRPKIGHTHQGQTPYLFSKIRTCLRTRVKVIRTFLA